jgi:hypothetical protein
MRLILTVFFLGLTLYAFFDCARTEQEYVRKAPKWAWLLFILLFETVGAIFWFTIGRPKNSGGPSRPRNGKIIPPDDDPDFLRKI